MAAATTLPWEDDDAAFLFDFATLLLDDLVTGAAFTTSSTTDGA